MAQEIRAGEERSIMQGTLRQPQHLSGFASSFSDAERDEIVRLQFQCAALKQRLSDENVLRASAALLESQVAQLSRELSLVRAERDRYVATIKATATLSRSILDDPLPADCHGAARLDFAAA